MDGWLEGNSHRNIAVGIFWQSSHYRGGKTHDLRSRSIRLVKVGLRLMRAVIVSCSVTRAKTSTRILSASPNHACTSVQSNQS
ncbi:hypothetical protein [Bradyrhizobium japonicum]|uniref:hypothetical protein n=1 Tax=unclassified Bradyrhizobium TaxID=2631580 RepID=UPI0034D19988